MGQLLLLEEVPTNWNLIFKCVCVRVYACVCACMCMGVHEWKHFGLCLLLYFLLGTLYLQFTPQAHKVFLLSLWLFSFLSGPTAQMTRLLFSWAWSCCQFIPFSFFMCSTFIDCKGNLFVKIKQSQMCASDWDGSVLIPDPRAPIVLEANDVEHQLVWVKRALIT